MKWLTNACRWGTDDFLQSDWSPHLQHTETPASPAMSRMLLHFSGHSNTSSHQKNVCLIKPSVISMCSHACGPLGLVLNSSTRSILRLGLTVPSITANFRPIFFKWTATMCSMLVHWDTITLPIKNEHSSSPKCKSKSQILKYSVHSLTLFLADFNLYVRHPSFE